ncbi:MAG: hypothetical protein IT223_10360, partial [Crocinitomicaceae bacterium]|nr:hypothetical protein [Crocinitomicaceae bacterium]
MKKFLSVSFVLVLLTFASAIPAQAQNTLTFSQSLIVGSTNQTVPSGKVWKVEAIFGEQVNQCVPVDCLSPGRFAKGIVTSMYVNNVFVPSTMRAFKNQYHDYYYDSICTSYGSYTDLSCNNKAADPNVLPMWLPSGTVLASGGNTTYV